MNIHMNFLGTDKDKDCIDKIWPDFCVTHADHAVNWIKQAAANGSKEYAAEYPILVMNPSKMQQKELREETLGKAVSYVVQGGILLAFADTFRDDPAQELLQMLGARLVTELPCSMSSLRDENGNAVKELLWSPILLLQQNIYTESEVSVTCRYGHIDVPVLWRRKWGKGIVICCAVCPSVLQNSGAGTWISQICADVLRKSAAEVSQNMSADERVVLNHEDEQKQRTVISGKQKALVLAQFCTSFHNYLGSVDRALREILPEKIAVEDERDDPEKLTLSQLKAYDIIIIYCADTWSMQSDDNFMTALSAYLAEGGNVFILHVNCLGANKLGGTVFGGSFCMHPPFCKLTMKPVRETEDDITEGVETFCLYDELHLLYTDTFLQKEVLLEGRYCMDDDPLSFGSYRNGDDTEGIYAERTDFTVPLAWRYRYLAGKVLYICPGHNAASLQEPSLRRLIRNGVNWLAK